MEGQLIPIKDQERRGGSMPPREPKQGPLDQLATNLTRNFRRAVERDVYEALKALEQRQEVPLRDLEEHQRSQAQLKGLAWDIQAGGVRGALAAWRAAPHVRDFLAHIPR